MKTFLVAVFALAGLTLSGCIIVIERAPAEPAAPAKHAAAQPKPDGSSK
jgi:uncharacterized protein YceK